MGHIGFSYIGLLWLLMLFIPNTIWAKNKPVGYNELAKSENRVLLILERIGQILVTTCALIFSDFNLTSLTPWSSWFVFSMLLMLLYEISWVRYFKGGCTLTDFYRSFIGIPVPLALLPVAAFFLLGVYGKVVWLMIATIPLAVGHIGIHMQHIATLRNKKGILK